MRSLFAKESNNAELNEELRFHLEQATSENIASGMSSEEARAAKERFGSMAQTTEVPAVLLLLRLLRSVCAQRLWRSM